MADVDITSLSVEISAESQGAELNLDKLTTAISNLRTKGSVGKVCTSLDKLSSSIAALKQGFQEVGAGRLDCRISPALKGRRDELADLKRAFDQTVTQLDSLINSQKRLLHDVSHEVRSPLARMQLAIDLLEQQPERQSELLQRISRESARINALMDEGKKAGNKSREERLATLKAGGRPRSCPPAGKQTMGPEEFMKRLGAIPRAERERIDMTEAMHRIAAAKYPCPA